MSYPSIVPLILWRHANVDIEESFFEDTTLSPRGVKQAQVLSHWLVSKGFNPSNIWVSPFERAKQQAGILMNALGDDFCAGIEEQEDLLPAAEGREIIKAVLSNKFSKGLVIIGHQNNLERIYQGLTNSTGNASLIQGAFIEARLLQEGGNKKKVLASSIKHPPELPNFKDESFIHSDRAMIAAAFGKPHY